MPARKYNSFRARASNPSTERSALPIIGRIQQGKKWGLQPPKVMQPRVHVEDNLPKLRRPSGCFFSARHEPFMVMDGFKKRDLEGIANIKHAERTIAKPTWVDQRSCA